MKIKRSVLKELALKFIGNASLESQELILIKIATARCARVSYTVVGEEGKPDNYENDIKLHDKLAEMGHYSPFEHCAKAMSDDEYQRHIHGIAAWEEAGGGFSELRVSNSMKGWSGNFRGFIQYRKTLQGENKQDNRVNKPQLT